MKAAPVYHALSGPGARQTLVHTGQHYDDRMSAVFFEELGLPKPDIDLEVGSASHAAQTAEVMKRFEPVVLDAPAGLGRRLRRRELDGRGDARLRPSSASAWRTSRRACAPAIGPCRKRSTAWSPTSSPTCC